MDQRTNVEPAVAQSTPFARRRYGQTVDILNWHINSVIKLTEVRDPVEGLSHQTCGPSLEATTLQSLEHRPST